MSVCIIFTWDVQTPCFPPCYRLSFFSYTSNPVWLLWTCSYTSHFMNIGSCKRKQKRRQDFGNRSVHRLVYLQKLISAVQPVQEAKTACYNWTVFEPVDCLFFSDDDSIYWQKIQLDVLWYVNKWNATIVLTVFPYKVYIVYMYINTAVACNQSKP